MTNPSTILPSSDVILPGSVWTFDLVEERLIEAMALWRRAPGEGKRPYATDAPWHLMRRVNEAGDAFSFYDARGFDVASSDVALRPLPLVRAEHARMIEASGWIEAHAPEADRRLICLVLDAKAKGRRPQWRVLLGEMGLTRGADGLRMRYGRAVTAIVKGLDKAGVAVIASRL